MLQRRSHGALNIATGQVRSFRDIAQDVRLSASASTIHGSPRSGPMPHNGYRAFDIAPCQRAFPDFSYTPLEEGLARSFQARGLPERKSAEFGADIGAFLGFGTLRGPLGSKNGQIDT